MQTKSRVTVVLAVLAIIIALLATTFSFVYTRYYSTLIPHNEPVTTFLAHVFMNLYIHFGINYFTLPRMALPQVPYTIPVIIGTSNTTSSFITISSNLEFNYMQYEYSQYSTDTSMVDPSTSSEQQDSNTKLKKKNSKKSKTKYSKGTVDIDNHTLIFYIHGGAYSTLLI